MSLVGLVTAVRWRGGNWNLIMEEWMGDNKMQTPVNHSFGKLYLLRKWAEKGSGREGRNEETRNGFSKKKTLAKFVCSWTYSSWKRTNEDAGEKGIIYGVMSPRGVSGGEPGLKWREQTSIWAGPGCVFQTRNAKNVHTDAERLAGLVMRRWKCFCSVASMFFSHEPWGTESGRGDCRGRCVGSVDQRNTQTINLVYLLQERLSPINWI